MYLIYTLVLMVLLVILLLLFDEERRFRNSITHGLASKFWILRERRRFVRFKEEMKIRYAFKINPSTVLESKTADVSRKGLCIVTYEKLKKNTAMDLDIEVPGFSKPIHMAGQVMWTKELKAFDEKGRRLFYAGIKFFKISPEHEAVFLAHLNNLKPY